MSSPTRVRGLNPGECRLRLSDREAIFAEHLVNIAAENPGRFGGLNEWHNETPYYQSLHSGVRRRLHAGEVVLTRDQREFMHTVLAVAVAEPELFGNFRRGEIALWYQQLVFGIRRMLPPRGAGTYAEGEQ